MTRSYPKRLIEVDLPIREISAHARREKSRGPISMLHIWWARRPLAACRAVLCASLWPDPADDACPAPFREAVADQLNTFSRAVRSDKVLAELCSAHWARWRGAETSPFNARASDALRAALLEFIADFAAWESTNHPAFLATARALTASAHAVLDRESAGPPTVADPFSGGGAIPLEALRIGADAFATDLNPVAVLLERIVLEYVPKHGNKLGALVREWGGSVEEAAKASLASFYPAQKGETPIAYIWARVVQCEGPGCGMHVPLLRSLWLSKKGRASVALKMLPDAKKKRVGFEIAEASRGVGAGTVNKGVATCPSCGFATPQDRVRRQLREASGGAAEAQLVAVVTTRAGTTGRFYRLPTRQDLDAVAAARDKLESLLRENRAGLTPVPDEPIPHEKVWKNNPIRVHLYGMSTWGSLFAPRQALTLATMARLVAHLPERMAGKVPDDLARAVQAMLACAVDREAEHLSSLCRWNASGQKMQATFGRQALPMLWDFCEANPFGGSVGSWSSMMECVTTPFEAASHVSGTAHCERASATAHPLPDDSVAAVITDPPYYDSVPYAALADFFYVWLKRTLNDSQRDLFPEQLTPKDAECVVDEAKDKDARWFQRTMTAALTEARRIVTPSGIGVVVFAHKSTAGWEAQLQAMIDAGWTVTASWPLDTEMGTRLRAQGSAALASSIHLVCRPREDAEGKLRDDVGTWREVVNELPRRIHEWMPRLAQEGVVGADAIFACLGPALEVFSRYARVEKASGDRVELREYLEQVWAAVAKEALSMMFDGADASGLEEDARLTAMWLWTLGAGAEVPADGQEPDALDDSDDDDDSPAEKPTAGFILEYDAARKIAQGLGAHLERLPTVVELKKDKARLVGVVERARTLFAKEAVGTENGTKGGAKGKAPSKKQLRLFAEVEAAEKEGLLGKHGVPKVGETTLDRVHQSMILFGAGRSDALKRFVVEEGVGKDARFWKLAQSLSALYPSGSDEKRWVDGVLARKKSLGF